MPEPAGSLADRRRRAGVAGNERIRVLWLIKGLGRGGAEQLLRNAAAVADRETFDYEAAYLLPWKGELAADLESAGVPVHLLAASGEFDLRWAGRLRRLLLERGFDVVHVHSPYVAGIARLVVLSLRRRHRPMIVSTEHVPWSGYALPTRVLNAVTFPLDSEHIAVSEAVRRSIPRALRRRVSALNHGVPLDAIRAHLAGRAALREELGIAPDEVLIGTVAHLRPQKGYPILVAAAGRILARGLPARFVAVGDGPMEGEVRALAGEVGLGERFLFLGRQPDAAPLLAALDVFVLASLYEGLPLAVMEALALGIPVVATAVGGVPELIDDGVEGLLVPPGRDDLLADALEALIVDRERRERVGRAAGDRATAFDHVRAVRTIEDSYRRVAALRANGVRAAAAGL